MIIKVHDTIADLESDFLKKINSENNIYFNKPVLGSFEYSNPNIDMRYICISEGGNPKAIAVVQIIKLSVDVILKNIKVSSLMRKILNMFFCNDHIKILFCGNIFLSGEYGICFSDDKKQKSIINHVAIALDNIKKTIKPLHAIFIKDFENSSLVYSKGFENYGYTNINVEPNMLIYLNEKWKSFEDYKNALKSKYRIKANKADTNSEKLKSKLLSKTDIENFQDQLQSLYQNTIDNANFNAQVLNLDTYVKLKSKFKNNFIVKGYFLEGELVGFLSALKNNKSLDAHFIGLNYSLNKLHSIYPRILNDYVRLGIKFKVKQINLGRTASEIKSTIGARPVELTCYIKHKNRFINLLIRPFLRKIQIKSFKQHSPFK